MSLRRSFLTYLYIRFVSKLSNNSFFPEQVIELAAVNFATHQNSLPT